MNFGNTKIPRIAKISDSNQQNFWYLGRYLAELPEKKYTEAGWRILEESFKMSVTKFPQVYSCLVTDIYR